MLWSFLINKSGFFSKILVAPRSANLFAIYEQKGYTKIYITVTVSTIKME